MRDSPDPLRIGLDVHPGLDLARAGGHQHARPGDLDDAHPADVDRRQVLGVAERRRVDALRRGRRRGSSSRPGRVTGRAVDRQLDRRRGLDRRRRRRARRRAGGVSRMSVSGWAPAPRRRAARARRGRVAIHAQAASQGHQPRLPERGLDRATTPSGRARRSTRRASPGRSRAAAPARRRAAGRASRPRAAPAAPPGGRCPTRHGTHWPHDSSRKNWAIRRSVSTRSTVSSKTMITPEPSVAPIGPRRLERQRHVERLGPDEDARRAAEQDRPDRPGRPGRRRPARSGRRSVAPNSTS